MPRAFLLYGANGFTGELIARFAAGRGLRPILAGRDGEAVSRLAARFGFGHRTFSLDDTASLEAALNEVDVVLHCAGPFKHTYRRMAAACLRTGTHYLDITGELGVFQGLLALDSSAKEAGVMLLPGIGFDVVPTDCLAVYLKGRLTTATSLKLAYQLRGPARSSRGTARSFVEGLPFPGHERRNGELHPIDWGTKTHAVDFGAGPVETAQVTLGDVVTAYHSTGIPNIETYVAIPAEARHLLLAARFVRPLTAARPVQVFMKGVVRAMPPGPTDEQRAASRTAFWGEARDEAGNVATARLYGPEAYTFTALTALAAVERVLAGEAPPGFQTPGSAFGADFVLGMEGVRREDVA